MESKWKPVYNILERDDKDGQKRTFFNRVGTAFVNRDGSYNVVLDSLPLDGKLHIREPREEMAPALDENNPTAVKNVESWEGRKAKDGRKTIR